MNWLAMALAAASSLLIGFIWYHPKVFGTAWMTSIGRTREETEKNFNMLTMFGGSFLLALLATIPLGYMVSHPDENLSPFVHGFYHGAMYTGVMLALPVIGVNAIYEQRGWKYILINAGYWIVTLGVMAGIMAVFYRP